MAIKRIAALWIPARDVQKSVDFYEKIIYPAIFKKDSPYPGCYRASIASCVDITILPVDKEFNAGKEPRDRIELYVDNIEHVLANLEKGGYKVEKAEDRLPDDAEGFSKAVAIRDSDNRLVFLSEEPLSSSK